MCALTASPWCKEFDQPHVLTVDDHVLKVLVRQLNDVISSCTSSTTMAVLVTNGGGGGGGGR